MKRTVLPGLLVLLAAAAAACAQEPGAAEDAGMTLGEVVATGGWPMWVLGAMSVAALAFVIYFAAVFRQEAVVPRELVHDLHDALEAGRPEEAQRACVRSRSALGAIAGVALAYLRRTERPDPGLLREIIEGEGGRQAALMQNQTQYLLDIAVIAPMVGLLGTVIGMLRAFSAVALDIAKAKPMVLAGGVSQALITTAAGLIVGIPAMAFYAFFRGRTSRLTSTLEAHAADLLTALLHRNG